MITFSLTEDIDLVKSILHSPNNWPYQYQDDHFYEFDLIKTYPPYIKTIKVEEDSTPIGIFILIPLFNDQAEVHLALLPAAYGKTINIGKEALDWIWRHLPFEKLIGPVLKDNKLVIRMVEAIGFTYEGLVEKAWLKDTVKQDLVLYGINRPNNTNGV